MDQKNRVSRVQCGGMISQSLNPLTAHRKSQLSRPRGAFLVVFLRVANLDIISRVQGFALEAQGHGAEERGAAQCVQD